MISLPVHTAVGLIRVCGASTTFVAAQASVFGSYLPPLFRALPSLSEPPQMTISVPVQIAVWKKRPTGALLVPVAVQVSEFGSYRPPLLKLPQESPSQPMPPQTIISVPVQIAV